jgi:chloramphenicol 3-O-phosphotransferase
MNGAILVTGPSAAGKTTVARALAASFSRGVHLEGDAFRRAVVSGRHEMTPNPTHEALEQLRLRYAVTVRVARTYVERGFTVVAEDVVAGHFLQEQAAHFDATFVLLPSLAALERRSAAREQNYGGFTPAQLHRLFESETPRIGTWIDTSSQTPAETVDEIRRRLPSRP